jgi:heparosan-N-sulfate-glucuronate 5-epimerase
MAESASQRSAPQDGSAGFFSSAATLPLPVGEHFDTKAVRGYYIDLRAKAATPVWPAGEHRLYVTAIQWGLACYERYISGEGEAWLAAARDRAEELVRIQQRDGKQAGGFVHTHQFKHTFMLQPPWISAISQGEGASLLVRIFNETGDERYAEAARRALLPLSVDAAEGGVRAMLGGRSFPEEYPTRPPSFVLNGAIFTMWGLRDVGVALEDSAAREAFEQAVDTLAENLHRWDLGYWSRYDLFPHPVVNVASSFYHNLHINQLHAMHRLAPRPQLAQTADRWALNAASSSCRRQALARKVLFRILVPRNISIARHLVWSPLRGT